MNTSAVNNPLPILPSVGNNKSAVADASDTGAFNQALSQEISNRNDAHKASQTNKTNNSDTSKNATKSETTDKNNNNDGKIKSADDSTVTDKSKVADKDKPVVDEVAIIAADKKTDDTAIANPVADIMAFVAHLTQSHKLATDSAADPKLAITDKLKAGTDKAVDAAKTDLRADADANGKTAKQADFLSALEKATSGATEGGKTSTVSQAAETFAPLLAASSQTLAPNSTALQRANELQTMQANTFSQQVGSADWDKALGQKVVWMVQGAQTSATMTLSPPDLGPMQITLNVNNNQATASFVAHHPEVRHALENAMPRLREMLGDAGIQLGQSNVSAGTPDQQAAFENGRQSSGGSNNRAPEMSNTDTPLHVSHVRAPGASEGMVDTFA